MVSTSLKAVVGQLRSKEKASLLHPGAILPLDTKPAGDNPSSIASCLQRQSQPGQAAGVTVTLFRESRGPSRGIGAGKLVREQRVLQKGTHFKQNVYNMIQW